MLLWGHTTWLYFSSHIKICRRSKENCCFKNENVHCQYDLIYLYLESVDQQNTYLYTFFTCFMNIVEIFSELARVATIDLCISMNNKFLMINVSILNVVDLPLRLPWWWVFFIVSHDTMTRSSCWPANITTFLGQP